MSGYAVDYSALLGKKMVDANGTIIGAKSLLSIYVIEWDPAKVEESSSEFIRFEYRLADPHTMQWEAEVMEKIKFVADFLKKDDSGHELVYYFERR